MKPSSALDHPSRRSVLQVERILLPLLIVVVLVMGGLFYFDWNLLRESHGEVDRLHRVLQANEGLLSALKDLETGQRGYLLTGDRAYLEPYQQAKSTIPGWLDSLQAVVIRPDQLERVAQADVRNRLG